MKHRSRRNVTIRPGAWGDLVAWLIWAAAMALFAFLVLVWWAPRADATRIVPGAALPDVCRNVKGTQTVLDITTAHRFRVVHVDERGNVCRKVRAR